MARTLIRYAAAAFVALLLGLGPVLAVQAFAQAADGPGAGKNAPAGTPPGLEAGTPGTKVIPPADVQLYQNYPDKVVGRVSIPDEKLAVLVQPEGREWRAFRMKWLQWGAGIIIVGTLLALAVFFLIKGRIRVERGLSGRWVPRFSFFERFAHWATAVSFIVLALTGLVVTFGRFTLLPLLGHEAFWTVAELSKYLHNFSALPFVLGIIVMTFAWIRDNIPNREDLVWLRQAGGIFKGHSPHPETGRFNAGQKGIFWAVVLGGFALAITGYLMMTPFTVTGVGGQQILHIVHAVVAALLTAVILAHIYIGSLGMEGAFDAMGRGEVDENWAMEHHAGWYKRVRGQQRPVITRDMRGTPAE